MYKMCKSEQSANRQRELEQQLLSMMKTTRFDEISVSDICIHANIPRKSFYRYFSGKEGALHALIDHTLLDLENFPYAGGPMNSNIYRNELVRFFQFWQAQKTFLDALAFSGLSGELVTRTTDYALSNSASTRRFMHNSEVNTQEYGTTFGVCGLMSMVLNWHKSGYLLSSEQMADISVNLLTKPLMQPLKK